MMSGERETSFKPKNPVCGLKRHCLRSDLCPFTDLHGTKEAPFWAWKTLESHPSLVLRHINTNGSGEGEVTETSFCAKGRRGTE